MFVSIPCDPRVLSRQNEIIATLTSGDTSSLAEHDLVILTNYQHVSDANAFVLSLGSLFSTCKVVELPYPVVGTYALVNALFAEMMSYAKNMCGPHANIVVPVFWLSERGNQSITPAGLDELEAMYMKTKQVVLYGESYEMEATAVEGAPNGVVHSKKELILDSFVFPHDMLSRYGSVAPMVRGMLATDHFRHLLARALMQSARQVQDWEKTITVLGEPLPTVKPEYKPKVVSSPAEATMAGFTPNVEQGAIPTVAGTLPKSVAKSLKKQKAIEEAAKRAHEAMGVSPEEFEAKIKKAREAKGKDQEDESEAKTPEVPVDEAATSDKVEADKPE